MISSAARCCAMRSQELSKALTTSGAKKVLKAYQPDMYQDMVSIDAPAVKQQHPSSPRPEKTIWPRAEQSSKYTVIVSSCAVRAEPRADAEAVGARSRGTVVELFEFDPTRRWRRVYADGQVAGGWMLLEHEEFGCLLEPLEAPAVADAKCPQEVY
ncbi:unnamed protein product [Symbiodinium pilosum]|uniref:SH3 domain-containing protein n=1 Tax=Symbiodinium pilosum TaxID=2952 RepID=A0A812L1M1_SYMPI|nr:unnamed protein product [Symbiodinium pilosum]